MELKDVLYQIAAESQEASQPTDLRIGTVTSTDPLEVTINSAMAPLRANVLYLTEPVVEKKIPVLTHLHYIDTLGHNHIDSMGGGTSSALTGSYPTLFSLVSAGHSSSEQDKDIVCYEHGQPLPIKDGYIILNRALEKGDKVLLLRVRGGQKFIILSRVF